MRANNWNPITTENVGSSYDYRRIAAMPGQKPFPRMGDEGYNSIMAIGVQGGLVERRIANGTMKDYRSTPVKPATCEDSFNAGYECKRDSIDPHSLLADPASDWIDLNSFWHGWLAHA